MGSRDLWVISQGEKCYLFSTEVSLTNMLLILCEEFLYSDHNHTIFCLFQMLFSEKDTESSKVKMEEKMVRRQVLYPSGWLLC